MPQVKRRSVLSGIRVEAAMRRQVISADRQRSIGYCINRLIKYKVGALLVVDEKNHPAGVLSKTDLVSAYYAMLPKETPVGDLIAGTPLSCFPDDLLEDAIDLMHSNGVHRVYVRGAEIGSIAGTLAYLDVVGLLYKYCRACLKSTAKARMAQSSTETQRLLVKDVMSDTVFACTEENSLSEVIEMLITQKCGAVVVEDSAGRASGVISKTDLVLAYKHGKSIDTPARESMRRPVLACSHRDPLAKALQEMLLRDIQRLFVFKQDPEKMAGVLSLSDSARFRSGSCRACISGRLMVDG